jgi:hypothetical protein
MRSHARSTPSCAPAAYFTVKEQVQHLWPVDRLLEPWPMGDRFFWETKRGVLSYVIARPLMTAVSVVTNIAGGCRRGGGGCRWWVVGTPGGAGGGRGGLKSHEGPS